MARHDLPAHVHVTHWSGVYECCVCGTWVSWKVDWAQLEHSTEITFVSSCCKASTQILSDTVVAIIDVEVGPNPAAGGLQ